jgi:endonuclease/exonuclease/phosphatase family metal-dependent hydrolase
MAELRVMTRNLYLGASMDDAIAATDSEQLVGAASRIFEQVQDNAFPERAEAIAAEIGAHQPDLVALQEVALWRSGSSAPDGHAHDVELDYLRLLLGALADRGLHYAPAPNGVVANFDIAAPHRRIASSGQRLQDLRLTDRDVLLVRTDAPAGRLAVSDAWAANFDATLALPGPGGSAAPVTVPRGFVCVDATAQGASVRVVATHLDPIDPAVNLAQADELLRGPAKTTAPVVLLGDLNVVVGAGVHTGTYERLTDAGFTDAWARARPDRPALTCCAPEDLGRASPGADPGFDRRIDLVLLRGAGLAAETVTVVGTDAGDRTRSGLWPSDHAGVVAGLTLT